MVGKHSNCSGMSWPAVSAIAPMVAIVIGQLQADRQVDIALEQLQEHQKQAKREIEHRTEEQFWVFRPVVKFDRRLFVFPIEESSTGRNRFCLRREQGVAIDIDALPTLTNHGRGAALDLEIRFQSQDGVASGVFRPLSPLHLGPGEQGVAAYIPDALQDVSCTKGIVSGTVQVRCRDVFQKVHWVVLSFNCWVSGDKMVLEFSEQEPVQMSFPG